ncbi:MAG TPA: GDSL-type esterase/lipase family protein [Chitinophagaceae bacterium]|nr:GDSL-type esterase/lipase family protein [Chitinophagaceae bacterium]
MKKILQLVCLLLLMAGTVQKKKKVIFFGDSITEAGAKPGGFILKIDSMLGKNKDKYDLVGAGISGNKVYDLYFRLEDDVLNKEPDVVVIFIGVNDVWHKRSGTGTDADRFERFYSAILKKLTDKNIKVILCTPAAIGEKTDVSNEQDGDLNKYCNIVRRLATKNDLTLIDLRKLFSEYNLKNNPENKDRGILTRDGVHLNEKGNQLVAEEMLKAISKL